MGHWTDRFVGDRMAVDREFTDQVAESEFTSQEWGTIMTAVEFRIERPETPDEAQIVAETEHVEQVLPAIEEMRSQLGPMGGQADGESDTLGGRNGLLSSIKDSLGLGKGDDGADEQRLQAAERLAQAYAAEFQAHLQREDKWKKACEAAAAADD